MRDRRPAGLSAITRRRKLPLRFGLSCIILGVLIAGDVVSLESAGVISLWR